MIVPPGSADLPRQSMVQGWLPGFTASAPALPQARRGHGWVAAPGSAGPRRWLFLRWRSEAAVLLGNIPGPWLLPPPAPTPPRRSWAAIRPGSGGPEAVHTPPCWTRRTLEKRGAPGFGGCLSHHGLCKESKQDNIEKTPPGRAFEAFKEAKLGHSSPPPTPAEAPRAPHTLWPFCHRCPQAYHHHQTLAVTRRPCSG